MKAESWIKHRGFSMLGVEYCRVTYLDGSGQTARKRDYISNDPNDWVIDGM